MIILNINITFYHFHILRALSFLKLIMFSLKIFEVWFYLLIAISNLLVFVFCKFIERLISPKDKETFNSVLGISVFFYPKNYLTFDFTKL